ncbi:MAG: response regulator, partial [Planctomycetota bacterium]|nr:response regulator [Planctomycetota bacterium]
SQALPPSKQLEKRPTLRGKHVLVVDADEGVRNNAHALLERYGCIVETAHDGGEAIFMVRNMLGEDGYDAILADIRLPDMTGHEFMLKLKELLEHVPLILLADYGYDPGHNLVKCSQSGLPKNWVLCKPFRLDQLLETVERVIGASPSRVQQTT